MLRAYPFVTVDVVPLREEPRAKLTLTGRLQRRHLTQGPESLEKSRAEPHSMTVTHPEPEFRTVDRGPTLTADSATFIYRMRSEHCYR